MPGYDYPRCISNFDYSTYCSGGGVEGTICVDINGKRCIDICPAGYYCPDFFTQKRCSVGSYCIEGSPSPDKCGLGGLVCPREKMTKEDPIILLFLCIGLVIVLIEGYRLYSQLKLKYSSKKFDHRSYKNIDALLKVKVEQQILLDAVNKLNDFNEQSPQRSQSLSHLHQSSLRVKKPPKSKAIVQSKQFEELGKKMNRGTPITSRQTSDIVNLFEFTTIPDPITVSFTHLNLCIKSDRKRHIIKNLFGVIRPYNITALVGTSGSGKTTLLNLLRGEATYAVVSGDIHVNGRPVDSLKEFQRQSAFVPQDDIMYTDLSVEECVTFAALLFNNRGYRSKEDCSVMVSYLLNILGIEFVRHAVIGTPDDKSISGGQKKRVSVAMEMVREAPLFFLDEPTSGLDSASSMSLLNTLMSFAMKGANIVATLHQPRQEILDVVNSIIVLGPGGHLVYTGPAIELMDWLKSKHFTALPSSNIVDYAMDVLSGFVVRDDSDTPEDIETLVRELSTSWRDQNMKKHMEFLNEEEQDINSFYSRVIQLLSAKANEPEVEYTGGTFWTSFSVAFYRQRKLFDRGFGKVAFASYVMWCLGYVMIFLFGNFLISPDVYTSYRSAILCVNLAFGTMAMAEARNLFTIDYLMRQREESGGINELGLFMGKVAGNGMEVLFYPLAFVLGAWPQCESRANFEEMWLTFILLYLAISGLANLCAVSFTVKNGNLVAMGSVVVLWAFGGMSPTTTQMKENMGFITVVINYVSPFKWAMLRMLILDLTNYPKSYEDSVTREKHDMNLDWDKLTLASTMLLVYWFVTNMLAYVMLVWKRHDYEMWRCLVTSVIGDDIHLYIPVRDDDDSLKKSQEKEMEAGSAAVEQSQIAKNIPRQVPPSPTFVLMDREEMGPRSVLSYLGAIEEDNDDVEDARRDGLPAPKHTRQKQKSGNIRTTELVASFTAGHVTDRAANHRKISDRDLSESERRADSSTSSEPDEKLNTTVPRGELMYF